jgi:hypothetical protein
MNISSEEAAVALREIEASRTAMRNALRTHRGHLHLWLWGVIWIITSTLNWVYGVQALHANWWIQGTGVVLSLVIGFVQSRQVQGKIDRRFIGVCATLLVFGYVIWPVLFGGFHSYKTAYAYFTVLWMQLYMVGGIWFDNFWFWIGLVVTILTVGSLLLAPASFWAVTLLFGFILIGSGFYMRYGWR